MTEPNRDLTVFSGFSQLPDREYNPEIYQVPIWHLIETAWNDTQQAYNSGSSDQEVDGVVQGHRDMLLAYWQHHIARALGSGGIRNGYVSQVDNEWWSVVTQRFMNGQLL